VSPHHGTSEYHLASLLLLLGQVEAWRLNQNSMNHKI